MPRLHSTIEVGSPYERVKPLYERADGLAALTPSFLEFSFEAIEGPLEPLETGSRFRATVRPYGKGPSVSGTVEIVEIEFGDSEGYVEDTVLDGPFDHWRHRRSLKAIQAGTRITDDLHYRASPGGFIGSLGTPWFLSLAFAYRRKRLQTIFGQAD